MRRPCTVLFALVGAVCVLAGSAGAAPVVNGDVNGDLGFAGCFVYAGTGQANPAYGCVVVQRLANGGGVAVTVRRDDAEPITAVLDRSTLRWGASPQNYASLLLDGDVPGVGHLSLYTDIEPYPGPYYASVCLRDPPLTMALAATAPEAIRAAAVAGWVDGKQVVRYGVACAAVFDGPTVGHWFMS